MRLMVAIFFLPILALAQGVQPVSSSSGKIADYLISYAEADGNNSYALNDFQHFIQKLESKRESFKNDELFLNHIFTKTHQRFLKNYKEYAAFGELVKDGTYNCLTGTALYALLLEHFGFKYQIIETNYHIFLLAETAEGKILLESTDPLRGFINDPREVERRASLYKQNEVQQTNSDKIYYRYTCELYNQINLDEMLGLLHYNRAIEAYNKQQVSLAIFHLDHAIRLHQSPRIKEFSKIILLSVSESKLESSIKENYLRKLQSIRRYKMPVVASEKSF